MKDRLLGRVIADRYRLESRLGVGGMGAVYRARHLLIDRIVAIKILQPERRGEEHFRAWFLREARAANRVNHANIVDITDFGETEDGLAYLVMELLIGDSLSMHIARGQMELTLSVDILEQTTAALARAHDLGVIHRDLKPDNIHLVNKGGRKNFVKVIDFGLARLTQDGRLAAKGAVFGTPEYMSPEQAHGEDATPSSDLYSIGIIFFEMLTGRLPFSARDRDGYIESHKRIAPKTPETYRKNIDPHASRIIMTLLEKDPAKRFRDAHHLLDEFKKLQRRVAPVSPWDLNSDPGKRNPASPFSSIIAASLDDVARWALKATVFGRMVATAYPTGVSPSQISESVASIWRLAAASTRLDGEVQAEVKQNEDLQRRSRDFNSQVGRRIEDLSREQSRLKREIASANIDLTRLSKDHEQAEVELVDARKIIASIDKGRDEMTTQLRKAYERAGAAAARRQGKAEAVSKVEAKVNKWKDDCVRIDAQLAKYREQLETQSSSFEADLESCRQRLAAKLQERESYTKALSEAANLLSEHFRSHEECQPLFAELEELEKNSAPLEKTASR